ncbi:oxidoreductase [Hyphomonas atlantica]|uniref:oxidoreductase n=2 Tax=Hyphomonas atlantica TaxID=1280948 RepID=UPI00355A3AF7
MIAPIDKKAMTTPKWASLCPSWKDQEQMIRALLTFCLATLMASAPAAAFEMRAPTEEVVLVFSGEIAVTNQGDTAAFDRAMLEELGGDIIVTSTIWTHGVLEFEGVRLSKLAELLGIESGVFVGFAINDYSVEIPVSDAFDYQPIIAYKRDGKFMSVRDKGPLWIIYPYDLDPATNTELIFSRSIWQLDRLVVER